MVCKTCGGQMNDTDKFCRFCGTTVPAAPQQPPVQPAAPQSAPAPTPTYTPAPQATYTPGPQATYTPGQNAYGPQQPKAPRKGAHLKAEEPRKPKKAGKGLLIGGCIAAAVVLVALAVILIISGNPSVKVGTAFKNTADAFGKIGQVWCAEEVAEFSRKEAVSLSMDASVNNVSEDILYYYNEAVAGLGVRVDMDMNLENREMGMMASAYLGSTDLMTLMLSAEDEMVYLGAPDFLNDFYCFNTETVMKDLDDMGAGLGEAASISFNIFEMIEIVKEYSGSAEENQKAITEATTALLGEIQFDKGESTTVKVGGESLKCKGYTVLIPQDALEDWLGEMEDIGAVDAIAMMEELLNAMNLPEDIVEELMYDFEYDYSAPDYSELYEALDILGDIELQIYVKSNKVAGIVYEDKIDGSKVEIGLYIGGEKYADCIEMEVKIDGEKLTIESEGDHTARDGVFTDELTIKMPYDDKVEMQTKYDPESGDLSIRFGNEYAVIDVEGTYLVNKDNYTLDLSEISFAQEGEEILSMGLSYEITDYEKRVKVSDARNLTDLTGEDIESLMEEVEGNAMEWAMGLATSHPELLELLGIYF